MDNLPTDPAMLLSVVNMKLRDHYDSLDALCDDLDIDQQALRDALGAIGYEYDTAHNRFA